MKKLRSKIIVTFLTITLMFTNVLGSFNPIAFAEELSTVAAWSYTAEATMPAAATTGTGTLDISGAAYKGYTSGALAANAWTLGGGWVISVDATEYKDLQFSASMRSSSTGPGRFDLEYSLDAGASWTVLENSQISVSTSLSPVYSAFALPEAVNGKQFLVRVTACELIKQNGEAVESFGSSGTSNINQIIINGTQTSSSVEEPVKETCQDVQVSIDSGEVENGTSLTLSCATEGASIYFNTNDTENYSLYTDTVVISANTEIHAFASKEGFNDSTIKTFTYTVKVVEEKTGNKLDSIKNGDQIILFNTASGMVMSETATGTKLSSIAASVVDESLETPSGAAILTVSIDENGFYIFTCDGLYLTAGSTGGSLTLESSASDYSIWNIESTTGGYHVINVNAAYNTKKQ